MKKPTNIAAGAALLLSLSLCGCSDTVSLQTNDHFISMLGTETYYEDGMFSCNNMNLNLLRYYSAETGKNIPICTKPNCTHDTASPDCNAIVDSATGIVKTENGLFFFNNDGSDIALIHSDLNGLNRKKTAVVEDGIFYSYIGSSYGEDYALYIYYDTQGLDEMEEGDFDYQTSDKFSNYVDQIDLNSGEVKNILYKKDYAAQLTGALIYDNKLIYSYRYYTEDIRFVEWEEQRNAYREGIYSLDLKTGEEKHLSEGYTAMSMIRQSFECFDPENIVCKDLLGGSLYLYSLSTGKFTEIDKCATTYRKFAADSKDIIYMRDESDNEYQRYNIETGEISTVPLLPEGTDPVCIVGDTVWVSRFEEYDEELFGYDRQGHISRSDFFEGNWDKISFYE